MMDDISIPAEGTTRPIRTTTRRSRSVSTVASETSSRTTKSASRKATAESSTKKAPAPAASSEAIPKPRASRKGKEKAVVPEEIIEVKDDEDEDSDAPIFVGAAMAKKLSAKFTLKPSSSSPSGSSAPLPAPKVDVAKPKRGRPKKEEVGTGVKVALTIKTKEEKKEIKDEKARLKLLPPMEPEPPVPIPGWLGTAQALRDLKTCPVCKHGWKAKEASGPARWVSYFVYIFPTELLKKQADFDSAMSLHVYPHFSALRTPHPIFVLSSLMPWKTFTHLMVLHLSSISTLQEVICEIGETTRPVQLLPKPSKPRVGRDGRIYGKSTIRRPNGTRMYQEESKI